MAEKAHPPSPASSDSGARERVVDEILVLRAQEGDATALRELVNRWQEPLWRYAHRLTARDDAAWDILQESWLAIISFLRSHFRVFCERNTFLSLIRSQRTTFVDW